MTIPTQAQIEAAARRTAARLKKYEDHSDYAAGNAFEMFADELTAAARVGEQGRKHVAGMATDPLHNFGADLVTATIERCAQVADKLVRETIQDTPAAAESNAARAIAAAIRKLRDES